MTAFVIAAFSTAFVIAELPYMLTVCIWNGTRASESKDLGASVYIYIYIYIYIYMERESKIHVRHDCNKREQDSMRHDCNNKVSRTEN